MNDVTTQSDRDGHVVAIQVGDGKLEIHRDMSVDDAVELTARADDSVGARLKKSEDRLRIIAEEVATDPDRTVEYYLMHYAQSRSDDLLTLDLEDLDPEAHRSRVDEYHRYGHLGSALLYRDKGFSGGSKFFSATWPNFKWSPYRFNDRASSGKAWGGNIVFQHTWYRGRRFYMIGLPYFELDDFDRVEFNDTASSFVSLP